MTVFGYARVSSDTQTLAAQDAELHRAGAAKVYREKISGAAANRPQLAKLLRLSARATSSSSPGSTAWRARRGIS